MMPHLSYSLLDGLRTVLTPYSASVGAKWGQKLQRFFLIGQITMHIRIQSKPNARMAQAIRNHLGIHPGLSEPGSMGMPEVMKPNPGDSRPANESIQNIIDRMGPTEGAFTGGDNQLGRRPSLREAFQFLRVLSRMEGWQDLIIDFNAALTFGCFGKAILGVPR